MEQNTFYRKIRNLRLQTSELQNITFSLSQTCWDTLYTIYLSMYKKSFVYVATINIDGTWTYERKIDSHENEYEVRNAQVTQRVTECEKTYDLLNRLALAASRGEEDLGDLHEPPGKEFLDSLKYLDMDDKCYISGHSFGGATGNFLYPSIQIPFQMLKMISF